MCQQVRLLAPADVGARDQSQGSDWGAHAMKMSAVDAGRVALDFPGQLL